MPTATILIISYNEKDYLKQAIDSCTSQTYENKEIIIGDDSSNDGSIEMIKNLNAPIRYFVMKRDEDKVIPSIRVSNVIKRALNESAGDYFTILSGDDYYIDNKMLEEAVDFLENHREYNAYVYGFKRVNFRGDVINESLPKEQKCYLYWSGDYIHISCFVFRKPHSDELLARMCDDTGLEYILANGKWKYGRKTTLAYRQRDNSIQHEADKLELSILEAMIFQDILNNKKNNRQLKRASYSRYYSPIRYLKANKDSLKKNQYKKYLYSCSLYENDILNTIIEGKQSLFKMWVYNRLYAIRRRLSI